MIKRICIFLLMATLLFSLAVIVSAEVLSDGEAAEPETSTVDDSNVSDVSGGTDSSSPAVIVPELPDGYVLDDDFFIRLTLDAEHGWSYSIEELLKGLETDEYVYFVEEVNIPNGYDAVYSMSGVLLNSGLTIGDDLVLTEDMLLTDGNVIIITNVKDGEPPAYELPETGGVGRTPYTIAGVTVLLFAAVYFVILRHMQKRNAE